MLRDNKVIPEPEKLTEEETKLFSSFSPSLCFRCNKQGNIFKYTDRENKIKFFMRCDYGCTLSCVGYTIEETIKKWEEAIRSVIGWIEKQESSYGQKKAQNGKGKNKNE